MARVYFPETPDEISATCTKFFKKHKDDGDRSLLNGLAEYNYTVLGDKIFTEWKSLNERRKELDKRASQLRERRDKRSWSEIIKTPVMRGKNLIVGYAAGNPNTCTMLALNHENA